MAASAEEQKTDDQNQELRRALNDAYASVEGAKLVNTFSALTFEELAYRQIQRIKAPGTDSRPNELDRTTRTLNDVVRAIETIKKLPDDAFKKPDPDRDVNTPATTSEMQRRPTSELRKK